MKRLFSVSRHAPSEDRLHALDAVRALVLLLGIVYHAALAYAPGVTGWVVTDGSQSLLLGAFVYVSHMFRMPTFFFMAGFLGRMVHHRRGGAYFVRDRLKRLLVPLVVGWLALQPLVVWIWIWGAQRSGGRSLPVEVRQRPAWWLAAKAFQTGAVFEAGVPLGHLWFLYYLLLLYGLTLLFRWGFVTRVDAGGGIRLQIDRQLDLLLPSFGAPVVLAGPVAAALYWSRGWAGLPTPDTSLVPQLSSMTAYGMFLGLGWLLHRRVAGLSALRDRWRSRFWPAVVLSLLLMPTSGVAEESGEAGRSWLRLGYAVAYSTAMWCWVLAIVGVFLVYCSRPSAARRYASDSSYWLYLVHLPMISTLQVVFLGFPWHWSLKLALVLALPLPALLLSYHYLVRFTFVGAVLNGRRRAPPWVSGRPSGPA